MLGDAGFVMIAIAAMLATASSANASLYASVGLTRTLAGVGQFPAFLGRQTRRGAPMGLLVTAGVVLVVSNVVDLSAIASVGSAVALCVFLLVAIAGYRRRADTGANAAVVLAAIAVTAAVLVFFAIDTARNEPATFVAILAIAALAVVFNLLWAHPRPASGPGVRDAPTPALHPSSTRRGRPHEHRHPAARWRHARARRAARPLAGPDGRPRTRVRGVDGIDR